MAGKKNFLWFGAVLIFLISGIVFVFIPSSRGFAKPKTVVFGKWDGKPIEYVQDSFFIRQIQNISEQMRSQGREIDQFSYFQIMQSAFSSTVIRFAILDELNKVKYTAPDFLVNQNLIYYYLDSDGKYSTSLYESTPEITRISRKKQLTEEITVQRFVHDYFGTQSGMYGLKTSDAETNFIKNMASPERSFSYIAFPTSDFPETEIKKYGVEHSELFLNYNVSMISLDNETDAKRVDSSISRGEISFEDAVATYSTHKGTNTDGKLLDSYAYQLRTQFTDSQDLTIIENLNPGEITGILKFGSSYAILRSDEPAKSADFSKPEVLDSVRSYVKTYEAGLIQDYHLSIAQNFVEQARTTSFVDIAGSNSLQIEETQPFALNYGNSEIFSRISAESNPELASAQNNEHFFKQAFSLEPGAISDPILLDGYIVVLTLLEEKAYDQDNTEMIPYFYTYYATTWAQESLTNSFLQSNKLEDNFLSTYLKYFLN